MARLGLQRWGYIQPKALEWLTYNTIIVSPLARSFIQGVLPPLLLPLLFVVLPFILRGKFVVQHLVPGLKIYSKALAWYECIPRYSMISVSVYRRFYIFLLMYVKLCYSTSIQVKSWRELDTVSWSLHWAQELQEVCVIGLLLDLMLSTFSNSYRGCKPYCFLVRPHCSHIM